MFERITVLSFRLFPSREAKGTTVGVRNPSMPDHNYFVYITTNTARTVLYVGVTNNLSRRLQEHYENSKIRKTFAGLYYCYHLIYFERHSQIIHAIEREKEIKKWNRKKKEALITKFNPDWRFLNEDIQE